MTIIKSKKELRFTVIVPNINKSVIKMAKRNSNWRYKYPPCPDCKAIGIDGLTMTRLGHLRCRSCNAMFTWKYGRNFNIKIVKSMGD